MYGLGKRSAKRGFYETMAQEDLYYAFETAISSLGPGKGRARYALFLGGSVNLIISRPRENIGHWDLKTDEKTV